MMQDTHRLKRNERGPIYKRAQGPKGASGRAPLQSPRGQSLSVLSVAPCRVSQLGRAGALDCSPQTGVWGRAPILTPKNFGALLKYLALGIDHDQVEFLSTEAPGLEPPQVDHQLPSDGHHGLFLQRPVSAAQDFLPFLNRLILGLKEDQAPGRLHSDAPNGWYSHFGDRAQAVAWFRYSIRWGPGPPGNRSCAQSCNGSN